MSKQGNEEPNIDKHNDILEIKVKEDIKLEIPDDDTLGGYIENFKEIPKDYVMKYIHSILPNDKSYINPNDDYYSSCTICDIIKYKNQSMKSTVSKGG